MSVSTRRTHVILPETVLSEIDDLVGSRGRSRFLTRAAQTELLRLRQLKALQEAAGTWKDADHPELRKGSAAWVRKLRRSSDRKIRY